jgi:D-alanyl-D-alanine dipeptidase
MIELKQIDESIQIDLRYAADNNFIGRPVYEHARAVMQPPSAEAVVHVHRQLKEEGFGLIIFDAYRPWSVTKLFWDVLPHEQRKFVANPAKGSKHNRGCAVDLSIYDLNSGKEVEMPSGFDEFTERASPDYKGCTGEQGKNRDKLRQLMESAGFIVNPNEWWHFDWTDWAEYPIYDIAFDALT